VGGFLSSAKVVSIRFERGRAVLPGGVAWRKALPVRNQD
jgi:hypothetical protein